MGCFAKMPNFFKNTIFSIFKNLYKGSGVDEVVADDVKKSIFNDWKAAVFEKKEELVISEVDGVITVKIQPPHPANNPSQGRFVKSRWRQPQYMLLLSIVFILILSGAIFFYLIKGVLGKVKVLAIWPTYSPYFLPWQQVRQCSEPIIQRTIRNEVSKRFFLV